MSTTPGSIEDLLDRALGIADPEARLRALDALVPLADEIPARVRAARAQAVRDLHATGKSWTEVGAVLGVTRQRAHTLANTTNQETKP